MAARRLWFVVVDLDSNYQAADRDGRRYRVPDSKEAHSGVFFEEKHAEAFAAKAAQANPGVDVYIFKQDKGFVAQPGPVSRKVWDKDGKYLPEPKPDGKEKVNQF